MKRYSIKQRLQYWFDERMSMGTGSMIRLLATATLFFVFLLSGIITIFHAEEVGGFFAAFWDSFASVINASVLYSGDGSAAYIVLTALAAIIGLFITSLLISILSSGLEEKVNQLRRGTSLVLEHGHTVILGFNAGAYELIRELCLAAPGEKRCIVVAGNESKETMEDLIRENVEIQPEMRIICRNIDIYDPVALRCCAIPDCKTVIINENDDAGTVKVLLAVSVLLKDHVGCNANIITHADNRENSLPIQMAGGSRTITLPMENIVARLIAHTCTQPGIAGAFAELFSFNGCEFYLEEFPELVGRNFADAMLMLEYATPVGISHNGVIQLAPTADIKLQENDLLLVLEETRGGSVLPAPQLSTLPETDITYKYAGGRVLILGGSNVLAEIVEELRDNGCTIVIADISEDERESICGIPDVTFSDADINSTEQLEALMEHTGHVVVLSGKDLEPEEADLQSIYRLLRLREMRERLGLSFNVTAEMKLEKNKRLIQQNDYADFIVASDISAMMVSQVAEMPELMEVFRELLSNSGSELYLIPASVAAPLGTVLSNSAIRQRAMEHGAVYLGYTKKDRAGQLDVTLNPPIQDEVAFKESDSLIILTEDL